MAKRPSDYCGRRKPVRPSNPVRPMYVRKPSHRWSNAALALIVAVACAIAIGGTLAVLRGPQITYEAEKVLPQSGLCTANMHQLLLPDKQDILAMHERGEYAIGHMVDGVWTIDHFTWETMTDDELAIWDRIYGITDEDRSETWLR